MTAPPALPPPIVLPDRENIRRRIAALSRETNVLRRLLRQIDRTKEQLPPTAFAEPVNAAR